MEIHQLRYFVSIAEEASFSRAAKRMRVAQPSLSQQIKKLEDELEQTLFVRLPRRVALTEAGKRLLPYARQVLGTIANARASVEETKGEIKGRVVLGAIPTIAPFVLPGVVAQVQEEHPKVELALVEETTNNLVELLEDGEVDVALISNCRPAARLHLQNIGTEPLHLLLPETHRLAGKAHVQWREIKTEPLLVLNEQHCLSTQVNKVCRKQGLAFKPPLRAAQLSTITGLVRAGFGVSVVPKMFFEAGVPQGCACLPFTGSTPEREINILTNPNRYPSTATRAVEELVMKFFQNRRAAKSLPESRSD